MGPNLFGTWGAPLGPGQPAERLGPPDGLMDPLGTDRPPAGTPRRPPVGLPPTLGPVFDPDEMVARFRQRAEAVRTRGVPPIEGPERQRFREQAQRDFTDYAMIGDAEAELVDGILTLRIDLRPKEQASDPA
jgi:hypothetical protein